MASIADQLVGQALQSSTPQQTSPLQSLSQLANVAQQVQQIGQAREKLNMAKQELENNKLDKYMSAFEKGLGLKDKSAQRTYFGKFLPGYASALGIADKLNPVTLDMIQGSPDLQKTVLLLRSKVQRGEMSVNQALDAFNDPAQLAELAGDQLFEAEKFAVEQKTKKEVFEGNLGIKRDQVEATKQKNMGDRLSQFRDDFDRNIKDSKVALNKSDNALELLNSRTPIADKGAQRELAKVFNGAGVLTDQDVASVGGDVSILERAKQFASFGLEGKLTEENRAQMLDVLNTMRKANAFKIQQEADRLADSASTVGLSREQVLNFIRPQDVIAQKTKSPPGEIIQGLKGSIDQKSAKSKYETFLQQGAGKADQYIQQLADALGIQKDLLKKKLGVK